MNMSDIISKTTEITFVRFACETGLNRNEKSNYCTGMTMISNVFSFRNSILVEFAKVTCMTYRMIGCLLDKLEFWSQNYYNRISNNHSANSFSRHSGHFSVKKDHSCTIWPNAWIISVILA